DESKSFHPAGYQRAWARRKRLRRVCWGGFFGSIPLSIAAARFSMVLETPVVAQLVVAACVGSFGYGAFGLYYFKCPNCGRRFEEGQWWPFPDRCGHCGIVAGTMPPAEPDDPAHRAQRDA